MICSHMKAVVLAVSLLANSLTTAQQLSKPALRQNLDDFGEALTLALPFPKSTSSVWNFGTIAEPCKFEAQQNGVVPGQVLVYNVTYTDCAVPYVLCVHRDVTTPINDIITLFAKVPARMRQYVRTISFFPNGGGAYARGTDIVMFGNPNRVGVYLHEIMHVAEYSDAFKSQAGMADQPPWQNAYNGDSAVPDNYARTNQRENLAQHPMFVLYGDKVGDPRNLEPNFSRIAQQQYILRIEADQGKNQGKFFATDVRCTTRQVFPAKVSTAVTKRDFIDRRASAMSTFDISKQSYASHGISVIDPMTLPTGKAFEKTKCLL